MTAKRNAHRRGWPRGLYEPRPGYFTWRHPDPPHRVYPIGRVDLQFAKDEAIDANNRIAKIQPSLGDRVMGAGNTLSQLMAKMPVSDRPNTERTRRSIDKHILVLLGADTTVGSISVARCAAALEKIPGTGRMTQSVRSRMVVIFRKAMGLGWITLNPAESTETVKITVLRDRLTLAQFHAIREHAGPALTTAMWLLLVTGQDRDTVVKMHSDMVASHEGIEYLIVQRAKTSATNQPVAIPLDLGLDIVGVTLRGLLPAQRGYLVSHLGGKPVAPDRITSRFTLARQAAGIPDVMPNGKLAPTFYEIKSLAKRLYKAQGNVDTMHLFSHTDKKTDALYADPRGVEPIYVSIRK